MAPYCPAAVEAERLAFEEFWAEKDAQAAAKGKPPPARPQPEKKLHKWGRFDEEFERDRGRTRSVVI
ncbi:hypothetical protein HWV62_9507 [Athelia sp. TMB]|nr:hypothetical protein HWV62_9507 [Athelia sp. TMB]